MLQAGAVQGLWPSCSSSQARPVRTNMPRHLEVNTTRPQQLPARPGWLLACILWIPWSSMKRLCSAPIPEVLHMSMAKGQPSFGSLLSAGFCMEVRAGYCMEVGLGNLMVSTGCMQAMPAIEQPGLCPLGGVCGRCRDALEECAALDGLHSHQPREAQPGAHQRSTSIWSHARVPNDADLVSAHRRAGLRSHGLTLPPYPTISHVSY
jgi:hypothetical protein